MNLNMTTVLIESTLNSAITRSWNWKATFRQAYASYDSTMHSVLNSNSLRRFRGNVNGCLDLQMRIRRDKLLCWLLGNCIGPCRVRYPLILGYLWVLTDHGVTQFRYLSSSWRRTFGNVNLSTTNLEVTLELRHSFKEWWGWMLQGVLSGLRYYRL